MKNTKSAMRMDGGRAEQERERLLIKVKKQEDSFGIFLFYPINIYTFIKSYFLHFIRLFRYGSKNF